jgi:hypothetical protein
VPQLIALTFVLIECFTIFSSLEEHIASFSNVLGGIDDNIDIVHVYFIFVFGIILVLVT